MTTEPTPPTDDMTGFASFAEAFSSGWIACREHGEQDGEAYMRLVVDAFERSGSRLATKRAGL